MPRFLAALAAALLAAPAFAQAGGAALGTPNTAEFAPLALPAPNDYRAADGRPGPAYWQQGADYRIEAALDTAAHRVTGTVTLSYTNNSPLPLSYLWFQLEQNLFSRTSRGAELTPPDARFAGAFDDGGYRLGEVTVAQSGTRYAPVPAVDDTRMRVDLREPLAANGGQLTVTIPYSFVIPEYGADRMGRFEARRGTIYEVAQWYPRIAVYDDVNGWNALPYIGQGEFYLEYGSFDVQVTVPSNMTVVGSGALQNPDDVWTGEQRQRLEQAAASDAVVRVVPQTEVGRARRGATTTWRFRIENSRDFAWAASASFMLDAASVENHAGQRVLVMSAYPQEGVSTDPENPGWERATEFNRHTIGFYSDAWFPYPYPAAVSVAGVVAGMEYPGLQFSSVESRGFDLFGVIDHELGHNWFPMIVGSDERRHAWMDEGFNTFQNDLSNRDYFDTHADQAAFGGGRAAESQFVQLGGSTMISMMMRSPLGADQIVDTPPDQMRAQAVGVLAYFKPGKGLHILRNHVLGEERFTRAFREYVSRWAFRHPQPADFFRTMEDVSGEDLDWFWREWFYTTGTYDAAVAEVTPGEGGTVIAVENRGALVFPVDLLVTFDDGATERVRIPVEAFYTTDRATAGVAGSRRVTGVTLDPDGDLPDVDRTNDAWPGR